MVKSIFLQDGEEIFVDDEDYEKLSNFIWYKGYNNDTMYVATNIHKKEKSELIWINRMIFKGATQIVKGNDYRRSNLTDENPLHYSNPRRNTSSKYKGVFWDKSRKKWQVKIMTKGVTIFLGRFENEDQAALAYNEGVDKYRDGKGFKNIIGQDNRLPERNYKTQPKQKYRRVGKSGYHGVIERGHFITAVFKKRTLGGFRNKESAALAYNKCTLYIHGEDAILNDVPMTDELKEFIKNWEIPEKIKRLKE